MPRQEEKIREYAGNIYALMQAGAIGTIPKIGDAGLLREMQGFERFLHGRKISGQGFSQAQQDAGFSTRKELISGGHDWVDGYRAYVQSKAAEPLGFFTKRRLLSRLDSLEKKLDSLERQTNPHERHFRKALNDAIAFKDELGAVGAHMARKAEGVASSRWDDFARVFGASMAFVGSTMTFLSAYEPAIPRPAALTVGIAGLATTGISLTASAFAPIKKSYDGVRKELEKLRASTEFDKVVVICGSESSSKLLHGVSQLERTA